ncbi:ATP-binding protein [Shewanella colwelliana]|uniref:ATP-binding protein n=1 Tax=Shewanella colwelliana TaxID=23 RepID=UPI0022AEE663|nr:ATP-binding protein [Shewanella colwelliana]MCZ4337683.1 ATP-binding protein [Shewanella colwelliana]
MTGFKEFTIDTATAIRQAVFGQSSSPVKALVELAMNAEDAKATNIKIELSNGGFKVTDDGRGFESEESVIENFGNFCNPHTEQSKFARFRLGRGQAMALAKVTWRSNSFSMSVDFSSDAKDFGYSFKSELENVKGTVVKGTWFEPLSDLFLTRDLHNHLRYMAIPVFINGVQANLTKDDDNTHWDYEDELCKIKIEPLNQHALRIYNQGVFVSEFHRYQFGVVADVVSKQALKQNVARNEIANDCPVWNHINVKLRELTRAKNKGRQIDEAYRQFQIMEFVSTEFEQANKLARELSELNIRRSNGRYLSMSKFLSGKNMICIAPADTPKQTLELAEKTGSTMIISSNELAIWESESLDGLFKKLVNKFSQLASFDSQANHYLSLIQRRSNDCVDFQLLISKLDTSKKIIPISQLAPIEAAQRNALDYVSKSMAKRIGNLLGTSVHPRKVMIGECPTAGAWTDSISFIAVERRSLELFKSNAGLTQLALLLLHEYTHGQAETQSDAHDLDFYELFHNLALPGSLKNEVVGNASISLSTAYANELDKKGLVLPQYLSHCFTGEKFELLMTEQPNKALTWMLEQLGLPYKVQRTKGVHVVTLTLSRSQQESLSRRVLKNCAKQTKKLLVDDWVDVESRVAHILNWPERKRIADELGFAQTTMFCEKLSLGISPEALSSVLNSRYHCEYITGLSVFPDFNIKCVKHYPKADNWQFIAYLPFVEFEPHAFYHYEIGCPRSNDELVKIADSKRLQKIIATEIIKASVNKTRGTMRGEVASQLFIEGMIQ